MCAGVARFPVTNVQQGEICRCLHRLFLCVGPVMGITQADVPESWILTYRTPHLWGARVLHISTLPFLRAEFCTKEIAEECGKGGDCTFSGSLQGLCSSVLGLVPSCVCARSSPLHVCPCICLGGFASVGKCWKMTFRSWMGNYALSQDCKNFPQWTF